MTTFSPRVSKLAIIPVNRENLFNALIRFERSNNQIFNRSIRSLKDTCTRRLLLLLGDDHPIYQMYLSPQLRRYVTYDYLTETNNTSDQLTNNEKLISNSQVLCCRNCSVNNLDASKCRRQKCFAHRMRQMFNQLSCQIIPWEQRQRFAILENDDNENTVVFIQVKSNSSGSRTCHDHRWIEEQFYLLDLLRLLQINIFRE